jgi:hypothetical protein
MIGLCCSSGWLVTGLHRGGPASVPGLVMWYLGQRSPRADFLRLLRLPVFIPPTAIYLSIYLSICGTTLGLVCFLSFLILYKVSRTLGRGISLSQGRYLHTEQHEHRINTHRHPCLELDSNPRSQRSSERRYFMP